MKVLYITQLFSCAVLYILLIQVNMAESSKPYSSKTTQTSNYVELK